MNRQWSGQTLPLKQDTVAVRTDKHCRFPVDNCSSIGLFVQSKVLQLSEQLHRITTIALIDSKAFSPIEQSFTE